MRQKKELRMHREKRHTDRDPIVLKTDSHTYRLLRSVAIAKLFLFCAETASSASIAVRNDGPLLNSKQEIASVTRTLPVSYEDFVRLLDPGIKIIFWTGKQSVQFSPHRTIRENWLSGVEPLYETGYRSLVTAKSD